MSNFRQAGLITLVTLFVVVSSSDVITPKPMTIDELREILPPNWIRPKSTPSSLTFSKRQPLHPAVLDYASKIEQYIHFNCEDGERKDSTIPLPALFDLNAHSSPMSPSDMATIEWTNVNLNLQCNEIKQ